MQPKQPQKLTVAQLAVDYVAASNNPDLLATYAKQQTNLLNKLQQGRNCSRTDQNRINAFMEWLRAYRKKT